VEVILFIAYIASVGCVAMFLRLRDQGSENADVSRRLLDMERRAVEAERALGSRDARLVLEDRPYGMLSPHRDDLHAAHARIVELERENAGWRQAVDGARHALNAGREVPLLPPAGGRGAS